MQISGSIRDLPSSTVTAPVGQTLVQSPHPEHRTGSTQYLVAPMAAAAVRQTSSSNPHRSLMS